MLHPQQTNNNTRQQIKWKLQIIFIYYSSYADRNNFKLLKQQNYRRFLIDSQTIKTQSQLVHYDILFQKKSNTAIVFREFLELIPWICELVYKNGSNWSNGNGNGLGNSNASVIRNQIFNYYIHQNIQPLFQEIIQKSQFGQDVNLGLNANIDEKIMKKLQKIVITQRAYNQYIAPATHGRQIIQIFQNLTNFLKDFQVCPHLVSKSLIYVIFLSIMKQKIPSQTFTLQDFAKTLIIIAQISSKKLSTSPSIQLCSNAKIIKLLQRMQISAGFDRVSKKIMYQTAISPSFLKSFGYKQKQQRLKTDSCLEKLDKSVNKLFPSSTRHKNCSQHIQDIRGNSLTKKQKKQQLISQHYHTIQTLLTSQPTNPQQLKHLKQTFQQLCQYGQVANSKTLKSIKIKKLFQRINLTPILGQAWIDIQIVNLQRSSTSGKIEFQQFLELLSLVCWKIKISFQDIVGLVLNDRENNQRNRYSNHDNNTINRRYQYTRQQQKILKQILQTCQKQILKLYKKYSVDNPLLGFNQFTKMMYDFEIFPTIISKNKLYQIFSSLHDVRQSTSPQKSNNISNNNNNKNRIGKGKQMQNYLKDNKKIQFNGFLMGLIQVGQQICDESLQAPQKLIILLQKINQSQGYKKVSNISLVQIIRKKFAKFYLSQFQKQKQRAENGGNFDQLLSSFQ